MSSCDQFEVKRGKFNSREQSRTWSSKNQRKACNCKSLLPRGIKATDLANRTFDLFKVGSILQ